MSLPLHHFETVQFETVSQTGSTNSDLLERPFEVLPQRPKALIAWRQTAGRGRRGRVWQSDLADAPLRSLTFSMALERKADAFQPLTALSLVMGICIAKALQAIYPKEAAALKVKWPNDLVMRLSNGSLGKVGGILIETKRMSDVQRIVIGVGLNLFTPDEPAVSDVPDASDASDMPNAQGVSAYRAHSLIKAVDETTQTRMAQLHAVAQQLCVAMITSWRRFEQEGWPAFRDDWAALDALLGQPVLVIESDTNQWSAHHLGLDDQGQLRVMTEAGERRVLVGDVSLRSIKN